MSKKKAEEEEEDSHPPTYPLYPYRGVIREPLAALLAYEHNYPEDKKKKEKEEEEGRHLVIFDLGRWVGG